MNGKIERPSSSTPPQNTEAQTPSKESLLPQWLHYALRSLFIDFPRYIAGTISSVQLKNQLIEENIRLITASLSEEVLQKHRDVSTAILKSQLKEWMTTSFRQVLSNLSTTDLQTLKELLKKHPDLAIELQIKVFEKTSKNAGLIAAKDWITSILTLQKNQNQDIQNIVDQAQERMHGIFPEESKVRLKEILTKYPQIIKRTKEFFALIQKAGDKQDLLSSQQDNEYFQKIYELIPEITLQIDESNSKSKKLDINWIRHCLTELYYNTTIDNNQPIEEQILTIIEPPKDVRGLSNYRSYNRVEFAKRYQYSQPVAIPKDNDQIISISPKLATYITGPIASDDPKAKQTRAAITPIPIQGTMKAGVANKLFQLLVTYVKQKSDYEMKFNILAIPYADLPDSLKEQINPNNYKEDLKKIFHEFEDQATIDLAKAVTEKAGFPTPIQEYLKEEEPSSFQTHEVASQGFIFAYKNRLSLLPEHKNVNEREEYIGTLPPVLMNECKIKILKHEPIETRIYLGFPSHFIEADQVIIDSTGKGIVTPIDPDFGFLKMNWSQEKLGDLDYVRLQIEIGRGNKSETRNIDYLIEKGETAESTLAKAFERQDIERDILLTKSQYYRENKL